MREENDKPASKKEIAIAGGGEAAAVEHVFEPLLSMKGSDDLLSQRSAIFDPMIMFGYDSRKALASPARDLWKSNKLMVHIAGHGYLFPALALCYLGTYISFIFMISAVKGWMLLGASLGLGLASIVPFIAVWLFLIARERKTTRPGDLVSPDTVGVSPSRLTLGWKAWKLQHTGVGIRWSDIALIHLEQHQDGPEQYMILSIRTFTGQALILDSRCFESQEEFSSLLECLTRYARHAINTPALALAIQDSQDWAWFYRLKWEHTSGVGMFHYLPKPKVRTFPEFILEKGTMLKKDRYEILEHVRTDLRGASYLARTIDPRCDENEDFQLLGIKEDSKPVSFKQITNVVIRQYLLPDRTDTGKLAKIIYQFEEEVRDSTLLRHKHIARWLDVFIEGDRAFVVYELIQGKNLRDYIDDNGPLPVRDCLRLGNELADMIASLHAERQNAMKFTMMAGKCGYGFLSPDYFSLTPDMEPKLTEFPVMEGIPSTANLSIGLPINYAAPEAFKPAVVLQSDIYSLGCILYFMLTGEEPVPFSSSHPSRIDPGIPECVDELVARMTAQDLNDRFEDASQARFAIMETQSTIASLERQH